MKSHITTRTVSISSSEVALVGVNGKRNYLLLFNSGDKTAYISCGNGVDFVDLPPHNGKEWHNRVPLNGFSAKCLGLDTTSIVVWEA